MISYGNDKFIKSKKRIFKEAIDSKFFFSVQIYEPKDLDNNFKVKFNEILNLKRIAGYGIWRPHIIKKN